MKKQTEMNLVCFQKFILCLYVDWRRTNSRSNLSWIIVLWGFYSMSSFPSSFKGKNKQETKNKKTCSFLFVQNKQESINSLKSKIPLKRPPVPNFCWPWECIADHLPVWISFCFVFVLFWSFEVLTSLFFYRFMMTMLTIFQICLNYVVMLGEVRKKRKGEFEK